MLFCSCVFSPFSIKIALLGEERTIRSAFCTFVRLALWFSLFTLPLSVWERAAACNCALPDLFFYLF